MVSPLDHKLLRDLWRMKGQAAAIGMVIALGVGMLVMMQGLVTSLNETRTAYYERYRLAGVFAPVTRAPDHLATRLAAIDGVGAVETRVVGAALIDVDDFDLPVQAQAVSLPDLHAPRLNDVFLTDGRMIDSDHSDEILLLDAFANAHDMRPGDRIHATMNGARRSFRIVGLARAPEFLYTTAPGELIPDDARFGVIWMSRSALAAALGVPPIFLAVAAFLIYIVINRMVQSEREEIGLMKAFGYSNPEVGAHYFKLVLAIAIGGALAGCLMGIAGGRLFRSIPAISNFRFWCSGLIPALLLWGSVSACCLPRRGIAGFAQRVCPDTG